MSNMPKHQPERSWSTKFGDAFRGVLVFMYLLLPEVALPDDTLDLWTWRGQRYLMRAIGLDDYARHIRVRSPRWGTVDLPGAIFRDRVRPFHAFTHPSQSASCPF